MGDPFAKYGQIVFSYLLRVVSFFFLKETMENRKSIL